MNIDLLFQYTFASNMVACWLLGLILGTQDWNEHTWFGRIVMMTVFSLGGAVVGAVIAIVGNILIRLYEFGAVVFHLAPAVLMA